MQLQKIFNIWLLRQPDRQMWKTKYLPFSTEKEINTDILLESLNDEMDNVIILCSH